MNIIKVLKGILILFAVSYFSYASASNADVDNTPIWSITKDGTDNSVKWVKHNPNPRFLIYDPKDDNQPSIENSFIDDLVLDRETGLIWTRDANLALNYPIDQIEPAPAIDGLYSWYAAKWFFRRIAIGNRTGWRLPTIEELSSIVDPSQTGPALPPGHPFINVPVDTGWWSITTYDQGSNYAFFIFPGDGEVNTVPKSTKKYLWPVRGGNGYATGSW